MLDIKLIRKNKKNIEDRLKAKDQNISLDSIFDLDSQILKLKAQVEELQSQRNAHAKEIGIKKKEGLDVKDLLSKIEGSKKLLISLELELSQLEESLHSQLLFLPNLPAEDIIHSLDISKNKCLRVYGEKKTFDFKPKNHLELNENLHLFDFKRGAKIAGSGWPTYKGLGARLEWALICYMIDFHVQNGYEQWMLPIVGKEPIMIGSAHLPKFEHQLFKFHEGEHQLYMIPTSEAALNGLHFDEIIKRDTLPLKYCAYTPCFRREAGAAGVGERGLIRTHQFNKVEMFCICQQDQSNQLFNEMVRNAEQILKNLDMHFKSVELVSGDISFAASKTIDLEVWLPGQERYYEVSSISNCTDFQSRRSKIREKKDSEKPCFAHTLNGSGLATSRLMVALLENNQTISGEVSIPQALRKYLGGQETISAN